MSARDKAPKIDLGRTPGLLSFDAAELATQVTAALGARGSGKSNVMGVIAEGLLDAGVQVVVLDYVGIWPSLRLAADGKTPSGLDVAVLGGKHGDIPLLPTAGAEVARALAAHRRSAVLDVSLFSKGDRMRFATDFAEALFQAKRDHVGPLWLLVEESQRFMPQNFGPDQRRMLGAFEEIAEVGRNLGIGLGLISQRPQAINKTILFLADNVFAHRTNGTHERKAIREWVQEKDAQGRELVDAELPTLKVGEALVWSSLRDVYGRFGLRKKRTHDAGATPLEHRAGTRIAPLDLGVLAKAMEMMATEARESDPRALRAKVAELERQLERQCEALTKEPSVREVWKDVARVPQKVLGQVETIRGLADSLHQNLKALVAGTEKTLGAADHAVRMILSVGVGDEGFGRVTPGALREPQDAPAPGNAPTSAKTVNAPPARSQAAPGVFGGRVPAEMREVLRGEGPALSPAGRAMLEAFAATNAPSLTWHQAAMLAGRKARGGAFERDKRALLSEGLVDPRGHDGVRITEKGRNLVPNTQLQARTPAELLALWKARLPATTGRLLGIVAADGPMAWAHAAGLLGSGGRGGAWERHKRMLLANGLVSVVDSDGWVDVAPELRS